MKAGDTLCWSCDNSTNSHKCCWAAGEPRSDWEATPTRIQNQTKHGTPSYIVHKCPSYDPDPRWQEYTGGKM